MPTFPPNATFTTRLSLPRPGLDDIADGPDGFNDLTDVLDPIIAGYASGTTAARPAGYAGQFYWNTDTKKLEFYNGTAWGSASGAASAGTALPVLDVGMAGQIRAGRQLTVADFTTLGLAQPAGLWNLSDLSNLGTGGVLSNKGTVPFGVGINGLAATAAVFAGSASQALYIADTGAADPFRIRTGSWGCWFRTAKRGVIQRILTKASAAQFGWYLSINASNTTQVEISPEGTTTVPAVGVSDVCDDRWHFAICVGDGTKTSLYVDGVMEAQSNVGPIFGSGGPLNIGGRAADSGAAAVEPFYGRVDEAFVTPDVLTDDQIRLLYCAKIPHGYSATPTRVTLNVRRQRRGGAFAVADFPAQPVRLHNFTGGALTDQGSGNVALTVNGTAVVVSGADGTKDAAYSFAGAGNLMATDAGLPAGTAARSYGAWFKTTTLANMGIVGWGTITTGDVRLHIGTTGLIAAVNGSDQAIGPFVADGQWHQAIVVEDNAAGDGVKRKLYVDGRLVGGSTVLNSITLAGANRFRVGSASDGTLIIAGQIDGVFIHAGALTFEQVAALWAKGVQSLGPSPKEPGTHVEAFDATNVFCTFDTLDSTAQVDLGVAA